MTKQTPNLSSITKVHLSSMATFSESARPQQFFSEAALLLLLPHQTFLKFEPALSTSSTLWRSCSYILKLLLFSLHNTIHRTGSTRALAAPAADHRRPSVLPPSLAPIGFTSICYLILVTGACFPMWRNIPPAPVLALLHFPFPKWFLSNSNSSIHPTGSSQNLPPEPERKIRSFYVAIIIPFLSLQSKSIKIQHSLAISGTCHFGDNDLKWLMIHPGGSATTCSHKQKICHRIH